MTEENKLVESYILSEMERKAIAVHWDSYGAALKYARGVESGCVPCGEHGSVTAKWCYDRILPKALANIRGPSWRD